MPKIIGIDLGTTNSEAAYMEAGTPKIIPSAEGSTYGGKMFPSVVAFTKDGQILVGEPAKRQAVLNPERTVMQIKRKMGTDHKVTIGDKAYTPQEVSAMILRKIKTDAEAFLGEKVSQAVITVPAYFNDNQRQATKDAGRIAGLEVLRLVNEPTAAALAYGLDKKRNGTIAVYDFGGGTFDISILKLKDGIFEVIATNGDTHLGGDDIDNLLIAVAVQDIAGDLKIDVRQYPEIVQHLRSAVIAAKILLSTEEAADIEVELPQGKLYQRRITREMFEEMALAIVNRTLGPCRRALKDADLLPSEIDEVVLVGGSTRIPLVRRKVEEIFGRKPHTELNPDEVVALGAAVQANILAGGSAETKDMLLLDVTPLSLGIEALGGVTAKIIHRNSTIPASATEHFTTGVDGQISVAIHGLQGEREMAKDCRSLARFDLKGIPPMPAGLPRIEVHFLIDANGILHVSAREQRSGKEAEIQVQPSYGLTDEQVEGMILDSFDNAEEDFRRRQLIEARNETATILAALEKGRRNEAWSMLSGAEQHRVDELEQTLREAAAGEDHRRIRAAID